MAWGETPGLCIHPGPAPGRDLDPPTIGVGPPTRRDVWIPNLAVTGCGVPTAIFVELYETGNVARDGVGGSTALPVIVAQSAPVDKGVGDRWLQGRGDRVTPVPQRDVASFNGDVRTLADNSRTPREHRDARRPVGRPGIDIVIPRLQQL